jgi:phosphoglycolate phosphatase
MHDLTLVFDLDGTLVDTAPDLLAAANHVLDHVGLPPIDDQTLRPCIGFGARYMIAKATEAAAPKLTQEEQDRLLERFMDYYGANIAVGSRPFEGAVAALERYQKAGTKLAVCTNKLEGLSRTLLDALDLTRYFRVIVGRDTLPSCKPHPDHLLGTIELAGGEKTRAIMIGDSKVDIATAKAAGVPVIAVTFGYTDAPLQAFAPDALIDHYRELEPAVAALMR